jgi:transposase-like protein
MPWQETQSVDQREQFIDDVQRGRMKVLPLCAHYGVSRKTGYKWIARAREEGRRSRNAASLSRLKANVPSVPVTVESRVGCGEQQETCEYAMDHRTSCE